MSDDVAIYPDRFRDTPPAFITRSPMAGPGSATEPVSFSRRLTCGIKSNGMSQPPDLAPGLRRIIHIDMDAFYASVE
jgi:hypothetical protein